MTFELPTVATKAADLQPSPLRARIFLAGTPRVGKSTLAAQWAPKTTLFLDLQHGTDLLPGEHYVSHIDSWDEFDQATKTIAAGRHPFRTVVIDTIDMAYKYADAHAGAKFGQVAAGLADFGKGTAQAEGMFRQALSRLFACRGLGLLFIGHTDVVDDDGRQRHVPALDRRVRNYVIGECEHTLMAERIGNRTVLHTQASQRYEAGSRLPLPEPLPMDARALYAAMEAGIRELVGLPPVINGITAPGPTVEATVVTTSTENT